MRLEIAGAPAERDREAAQKGVCGVPTIFVENDMFFGNDRLDFIRARLASAAAQGEMP